MGRRKLRIFILLCCLCFSVFLISSGAKEDPVLTIPILFEKEIPEDINLITEAASALVYEALGFQVKWVPLLFNTSSANMDPLRMSELSYLEKQGIVFDVIPDTISDASFVPLDDLLAVYGGDILEIVDEEQMALLARDGVLDRLPSVSDYVSSLGLTMRKDLVEKYDLDLSQIHEIEDLDAIYEKIQPNEPELYMVCSYRTGRGFIGRLTSAAIDVAPVCIRSVSDPDILVNYYATAEYRDMVSDFYRWNQNGYIPEPHALQNLTASELVEAGVLFSYFSAYKPGIAAEESISCGQEMVSVELMAPIVTKGSLSSTVHWGISDTCAYPEKAMEFLNLFYTNQDLTNLLIYGTEGIHYEKQSDGMIQYPDGTDAATVRYRNTQPWLLPNQFLSYIWAGNNLDLWEETRQFNESAAIKDTLYFDFDPSSISGEIAKIREILNTYTYGLEAGQLDPDYYLPKMLDEMEKAGVQRVITETQRQFDLWRKKEQTDEYIACGR